MLQVSFFENMVSLKDKRLENEQNTEIALSKNIRVKTVKAANDSLPQREHSSPGSLPKNKKTFNCSEKKYWEI